MIVQILVLYFEYENEHKFYNIGARYNNYI